MIGVLFVSFLVGANFYTDLLWFQNLDFAGIFWTIFLTRIGIRLAAIIVFTVFLYLNLRFTRPAVLSFIERMGERKDEDKIVDISERMENPLKNILTPGRLNLFYLGGSLFISLLFSTLGGEAWLSLQKFLNSLPFGVEDPIFSLDLGFYIFRLPFVTRLYEMGMIMIVMTGIAVAAIYILTGNYRSWKEGIGKNKRAQLHLSVLAGLFFVLRAFGYRLDMYNLLYSPRGVAFGASYTDVNAQLMALRVMFFLALLVSIFIFINIFARRFRFVVGSVVLLVAVSFLLGTIYPNFVQRFQVEPNEIVRETPFIEHNIEFTRQAYGLDRIKSEPFEVMDEVTGDDIREAVATINNIRLWDPRPLLSTYRQIQEMRVYYDFADVDVDRYWIDGEMRQVMLSVREMNQTKLPDRAQTWINQRLQYTHGYGVAMTHVSGVRPNGLPSFYLEDIPPRTEIEELEITRPEIYYGERTSPMVITNTDAREFNYPMGDENVYTMYEGRGGVQLTNYLRRAAFAFRFGDVRIMLSDDIHDESRLMFDRTIQERVSKIAPFLRLDNDPYPVIYDGRILWIQDAYTTTDRYPYSEPYRDWGNYVRNSIKIVIDAYQGEVDFYLFDEDDPLAQVYDRIFPDFLTPMEEMPQGLELHLRYPEDLFQLQARMLQIYHMQNPVVFYNQEDVWNIPNEVFMGSTIEMIPYYQVMQLPGEEEAEFVLMLPFTPSRRDNMISWLAARSEPDNYGEMILYEFPKEEWIRGPRQIEAQIDQHPVISQQISLWSQRGSRVIRGNLLVIPIKNSLIYVEPLYIQAEESELPELARVIVGFGEELVMEPSLQLALDRLFEMPEEIMEEVEEMVEEYEVRDDPTMDLQELANEALSIYDESQQAISEGDFARFGELLSELRSVLERMEGLVGDN